MVPKKLSRKPFNCKRKLGWIQKIGCDCDGLVTFFMKEILLGIHFEGKNFLKNIFEKNKNKLLPEK